MEPPIAANQTHNDENPSTTEYSDSRLKCPICLEDHERSHMVFFQTCPHSLCQPCHQEFIRVSTRCPVCRRPIRDETEFVRTSLERLRDSLRMSLTEIDNVRIANIRTILENSDQSDREHIGNILSQVKQYLTRVLNGAAESGIMTAMTAMTNGGREQTGQGGRNQQQHTTQFQAIVDASASPSPNRIGLRALRDVMMAIHAVPGMFADIPGGDPNGIFERDIETVISIVRPLPSPRTSSMNRNTSGFPPETSSSTFTSSTSTPGFLQNIRDALDRFRRR